MKRLVVEVSNPAEHYQEVDSALIVFNLFSLHQFVLSAY